MADSNDSQVWTTHSFQQLRDSTPYTFETESQKNSNAYRLLNIVKENNGSRPLKVLDYGMGTGLWRNLFDRKDFKYIGCDQNKDMVNGAKWRFPDDTLVVFNAKFDTNIFELHSFDLVFTSAVIQHNLHDQKRPILQFFKHILKPGGFYLMTENVWREDNVPGVKDGMTDGYSFTANDWEIFMSGEGFKLVEYKHPSEFLWVV